MIKVLLTKWFERKGIWNRYPPKNKIGSHIFYAVYYYAGVKEYIKRFILKKWN